jgi:hypothetical protein
LTVAAMLGISSNSVVSPQAPTKTERQSKAQLNNRGEHSFLVMTVVARGSAEFCGGGALDQTKALTDGMPR